MVSFNEDQSASLRGPWGTLKLYSLRWHKNAQNQLTLEYIDLLQVEEDMTNIQDSLHSLLWVSSILIVVWEVSVQSHLPTNCWVL